ncbi:MAG: TonB-dependent receptor [Xanthomonadales bacterium]|nr:TonB-dependent receptor [Xanthomonadales bacterium]
MAQSSVFAQTDQNADDQAADDELVLEEVIVTGIRRSLEFSADIKREAESVVDAITAQDIGLFSDNNIGEALARVPGVLLEREAGEGYRVTIRGLGPRFVRTTINGRTALSSSGGETGGGDDARGFTFNIMPSEVVSKAQVSKTTQARELEGGIGGQVDLTTNRPLDFKPKGDDFYFSAMGRGTYNDLLEDTRFRGTLFLNKKFGDSFGIFFGATIDEADRIDNLAESQRLIVFPGTDNGGRYEAGTLVNGTPLAERTDIALNHFSGVRYQEQPIYRDRNTYVTGLQFRTENADINFDWTAGYEDETRDDKRFWFNLGDMIRRQDHVMTSLTVDYGDENFDQAYPTEGTLTGYTFGPTDDDRRVQPFANGLYRRIPRSSDVYVGGLNVDWSKDLWTVEVDLGFAGQDTKRTLDRLRTRLDTGYRSPGQDRLSEFTGTYDISGGYPIAIMYDANGDMIDPMDVSHQYVEEIRKTTTWEKADDTSFRFDITKVLEGADADATIIDEIMFGFAWNEMSFSRKQQQKSDSPRGEGYDVNAISTVVADGILSHVNLPGFVHSFAVLDIDDPIFNPFYDNTDGFETLQSGEFDVTEENTALYLQGNFSGGEDGIPFRGNMGIRYVETKQTNRGWVGEDEGDSFIPADPDNPKVRTGRDYAYWLPAFNLAYDTSETTVLRFAANKALTRPDPIDMSSRIEINDLEDQEDLTASGGNPNLQPYTTISYDAILEWYPEVGGSYAIGLFYKDLGSFIANGRSPELIPIKQDDGSIVMVEYDVRRPVNTKGGTIRGVELQWHLPFDTFTDSFLQYFGINGSFTYVDAKLDAVVPERGTPISLRGTSEKSGNLVLYFEKQKFGARLAANYRSDYMYQEASEADRYDEWTDGRTVVDLNLDYVINKHMKIRFTANNLTDVKRSRYWYTPGRYFSDERDNGQEYVLEFRYSSD